MWFAPFPCYLVWSRLPTEEKGRSVNKGATTSSSALSSLKLSSSTSSPSSSVTVLTAAEFGDGGNATKAHASDVLGFIINEYL